MNHINLLYHFLCQLSSIPHALQGSFLISRFFIVKINKFEILSHFLFRGSLLWPRWKVKQTIQKLRNRFANFNEPTRIKNLVITRKGHFNEGAVGAQSIIDGKIFL